jgi:hypothetical protein
MLGAENKQMRALALIAGAKGCLSIRRNSRTSFCGSQRLPTDRYL